MDECTTPSLQPAEDAIVDATAAVRAGMTFHVVQRQLRRGGRGWSGIAGIGPNGEKGRDGGPGAALQLRCERGSVEVQCCAQCGDEQAGKEAEEVARGRREHIAEFRAFARC